MRKSNKIALLSTVAIATTVALSACGSGGSESVGQAQDKAAAPTKAKVIKVANFFATDHPQNIALREKFKTMVEEGSNGALKVEIYDNNKLGAEKEFYDGVRNGTIEMGISGMSMQSDVEKMSIPEWPFLFKDYEHVKKVLNGPLGDEISGDLESTQGVKPLAWSANGFRMFSSNKTMQQMSDFSGLRVRMPNVPNYLRLGELLGMNVTPMPISEVFTALEQKVVDGQDNPIATLRASGWYEVQTDVLESNHMFSPNIYIINSNFYNNLTPEQQKLIEEASKTAADYEFELMEKSYDEDKKFLESKGIKFTTPSDEFKEEMVAAMKPLYDEIFQKYPWASEMYEKILAEGK